jgi:hypothetical protein
MGERTRLDSERDGAGARETVRAEITVESIVGRFCAGVRRGEDVDGGRTVHRVDVDAYTIILRSNKD